MVLEAFGPPDVLVATEVAAPTVGAGQVLIDVELANVTFVETQVRAGHPPDPAMAPRLPTIPGNGVGGVVAAVGDGIDRSLLGARVVTSTGGSGAYAEQVAVDAGGVLRVPDELGMAEAIALLADGRTAALLVEAAAVVDGETVLVEAAAGGVGTLLVQLAGRRGARVLGAAGGTRKLALVRELGADATVDYRDPDWPTRVRAELPDGVDVAFDGVGGAIGRAAFDLVRGGGRFVPFGMASGEFAQPRVEDATRRRVRIVHLGRPTPADVARVTRAVLDDAAAGRLRPVIGQRFPLADAAAAHAAIERRDTIGKTLLQVAERR
ncbi:MAG TPA: zinc-binding dehydrogenase [Acidimicrobiia bacterium]|nr:zinc-binding dehydrogenase [Acidimicrobiia bacterium]